MEVWVFGYGSLCWNPGFEYAASLTGHVTGFARRFWQGNTTHRGTDSKPGRVATLVEEKEGVVWGRAFLVRGSSAIPYLECREVELGGYTTKTVRFHPQGEGGDPFPVLMYLATPENRHWLGEAPEVEIAQQILTSCGPSGHNIEYLLRLADFMREHVPEAVDEHLFRLENIVRSAVEEEEVGGVAEQSPHTQQFADRIQTNKLRCIRI